MTLTGLFGLGVIGLAVVLMLILAAVHMRSPFYYRKIRGFARTRNAVRLVVEGGTRFHFSLGSGNVLTSEGASALSGLALLRRLGELTSSSDYPPIATTGNGLLNLLAQDTLRSAHDAALDERDFEFNSARLTGLTPVTYAAGVMASLRDENISTNVVMGNFGPEVGLIAEAISRQNSEIMAASDNLTAQSVLYAMVPDQPIGEELFVSGAYIQPDSIHAASVVVQDILRWVVIIALLVISGLKLAGR